jgi:hypothetical protein
MKHPRPSPPKDAPVGTKALSGPIGWFSAALQVSGPDMDPAEITILLGHAPTFSQKRGEPLLNENGSIKRVPSFSRWSRAIKSNETDEWNISEVVKSLYDDLPLSLDTWRKVASLGRVRLSLGLSISGGSQDCEFDAELLRFLADRYTSVWLDVYNDREFEA